MHGPVLTENIGYYVNLYDIWSSYKTETEGVVIAYTSVYGNTKKAVLMLAEKLKAKGVKIAVNDLARCDMAKAVDDAFRYNKIVLATTTYNGEIFPFMREFINHLTERNFQNKTVAFIENGSWAPMAAKVMKGMFEKSKNITVAENNVKILSALSADSEAQLNALADELIKKKEESEMKYVCDVCGWEYDEALGDPDNGIEAGTKFEDLPEDFVCPLCGVGKDNFSAAE